ncbi:hypothetical protein L873DRAFT_1812667 [Choiromyces venosus 120613-1]|uniref:Uncharacterized protein n=1 Tax=Choiromyces venosus 120613-1 TaxID=1336337 RepID=A0A3N4JBE9_9PEZI|nr:hypothetical protein L873DRAFT_1812667 [Choiromyces venosus 120613-1]
MEHLPNYPSPTPSDDESSPPPSTTTAKSLRQSKLNQTESAFQLQKASWKPICQSKQALRRLEYAPTDPPPESKDVALEIKAAADERYYAREYEVALRLAERALGVGEGVLHATERRELEGVRGGCVRRLGW